jgi:hypothetical protein
MAARGARAAGQPRATVGVFDGAVESDPRAQTQIAAYREGLAKLGWAEGRNNASISVSAAAMANASVHMRPSLCGLLLMPL